MFNFKEELLKYNESLEMDDVEKTLSGDEARDILDIAAALVEAGRQMEESRGKTAAKDGAQ